MKAHFSKSKKANVEDVISLLVVGFVIFIVIFLGYKLLGMTNTALSGIAGTDTAQTYVSSYNTRFPQIMDKAFLLLMLGLPLVAIIGAYFIDTSPIFAVFAVIILGIIVGLSMLFGNMYNTFLNDGNFAGFTADFPIINFFLGHLPEYCIVIGIMVVIALFSKSQGASG